MVVFDSKACSQFSELLDSTEVSGGKPALSAEDAFFSWSKVQFGFNSLEPESKSFCREQEEVAEEVGQEGLAIAQGVSSRPGIVIRIMGGRNLAGTIPS